MYKYFKELEHKDEFYTNMIESVFDRNRNIRVSDVKLSQDILKKIKDVLNDINILDRLINGLNERILEISMERENASYEDWENLGYFFSRKQEQYYPTRESYYRIDTKVIDIYFMFKEIKHNIPFLMAMFPQYKEYLNKIENKISEVIKYIDIKSEIVLERSTGAINVKWPNAWYITPNGYLYNTGLGHKQGNLIYPLYYEIIPCLKHGLVIDKDSNKRIIAEILERGYVTDKEVSYFSNLTYSLPTVITPEVELDIAREEYLCSLSNEEFEKIKNSPGFYWPHTKRSYQKNLITLVIGHLAAEDALFESFKVFNDIPDKKGQLDRLMKFTLNNMDDILVRFCKFSIISSLEDKKIVTSSINGIRDFINYIDNGWMVEIVPDIIFDRYDMEIKSRDLDSLMISKKLESDLDRYGCRDKVLIYTRSNDSMIK